MRVRNEKYPDSVRTRVYFIIVEEGRKLVNVVDSEG
jgi:hypothetical protein